MREKRTSNTRSRDKKGFVARRKACTFCVDRSPKIDYKEPNMLRRFISDRGKMEPRHRTGVCAKHQRLLSTALKRARFLALLPYTAEHIRWSGVRIRARAASFSPSPSDLQ